MQSLLGCGVGVDRIEKDDPVYSGRWTYWALKDRDTGAMYIYRDGVLWQSGFEDPSFGAPVDSFRIGSTGYGGNHWHGLLDEFRISPSIERRIGFSHLFDQTPGTNC